MRLKFIVLSLCCVIISICASQALARFTGSGSLRTVTASSGRATCRLCRFPELKASFTICPNCYEGMMQRRRPGAHRYYRPPTPPRGRLAYSSRRPGRISRGVAISGRGRYHRGRQ